MKKPGKVGQVGPDTDPAGPARETSERVSVDLLVRGLDGKILLQIRDGAAAIAPLTWSFWGGKVESGDPSAEHGAVRELWEELGIAASPADFDRVAERVGSNGARSILFELRQAVSWHQIDVREGAGAAFWSPAEMDALAVTKGVRFFLENERQVFDPPSVSGLS